MAQHTNGSGSNNGKGPGRPEFFPRGLLGGATRLLNPNGQPNGNQNGHRGVDLALISQYALVGAAAVSTDAATALDTLTGHNFDLSRLGEMGVLHERMSGLTTDQLVDQAMASISTAAEEITTSQIARGPLTPPILLYVAERVMEARGLRERISYLRKVFDRCADLLAQYDGQRDAEGMIVARMLHMATDGIVAQSFVADQEQGLKGEHTVDQAMRVLNEAVQAHPDEMITGLGIYVSTPEVPVFRVPKSERQVDLANNLLFTNRGIITQRVMLGQEKEAAKIVTTFAAGSEFLEGDEYNATHPKAKQEKAPEKLLEWQRLNWLAIVNNIHPGVFGEALMIADPARGENRLMVKPEKYSPGRDRVLDDSVRDPLVAFALTNRYRPVHERMQTVTISETTPRAPHGLSNPDRVVRIIRAGLFPTDGARSKIGEYTKLVDKYGPFDAQVSLATLPALMGTTELKQVRAKVAAAVPAAAQGETPKVIVISEDRLPDLAGQLAHVTQSFLEATYFEIYGNRAERQNERVANYTGLQLYILGRMLEQDVYRNPDAVRGLHGRMNDLLVDVLTSRPGVMSEQVTEIARFVYETCLPNYPQEAQFDFLKKLIGRGLADRGVFDRWEELMRPLMVREQSFVPARRQEIFGVRPELAQNILQVSRVLFSAIPDLQDKPELLMDMLLRGESDFTMQVLRLAWVVGNRQELRRFKVGPESRRLAQMNEPVHVLTEDAKRRLEYEIARRLRIDAPLCIQGDMDGLIRITQKLSGDTLESQQQFMEGFAQMLPLFQDDIVAIDPEQGTVRAMTLPQGVPGMEEGGMFDMSVGSDAAKLAYAAGAFIDQDGKGEIPALLATANVQTPELAEAIMANATQRATGRDGLLMSGATSFFEAALGVRPAPQGESTPEKRQRRIDGFITNVWSPMGGYGRSLGLLAALTANNQAIGRGVEGARDLVQSLLAAEAQERVQAIEMARETGAVSVAQSVSDVAIALNTMTLRRVNSADEARAIGDAVRNNAIARAGEQLEMIGELQNRLVGLHGQYHEEEIRIAEERLALRRMQIEQAIEFAKTQMRPLLMHMYREKADLLQRLSALREKVLENQLEVVRWIQDVLDDQGDANALRFRLMGILREQTGTDEWWIPAPSAGMLQSYTGMAKPPEGETDMSRGKKEEDKKD